MMRELHEFLTERELYIVNHYPMMSYKRIAEKLGSTPEEIREVHLRAEQRIRQEKRAEQDDIVNCLPVTVEFTKAELYVIGRALTALQNESSSRRRIIKMLDPDFAVCERLKKNISEEITLANEQDVSIIEWKPLPAPADRYLLVRFKNPDEPGTFESEVAYSIDGRSFLGDNDMPFYADVLSWALLPYDTL